MSRRLIVGLGNPGTKYVATRHNVGFMLIDELANRAGIGMTRRKFNGHYGTGSIGGHSVVLVKPETFMNLSGRCVAPMSRYFDVLVEDILVIHDELDLAFGTIRLKVGGGHAGHNGLRSIHGELGSNQYHRLRMGIGRPQKGSVSNYVLAQFSAGDEKDWLGDFIDRGSQAVESAVLDGTRGAMNRVNGT